MLLGQQWTNHKLSNQGATVTKQTHLRLSGELKRTFLAAGIVGVIAIVFVAWFSGWPFGALVAHTQVEPPTVHILGPSQPLGFDPSIVTIQVGDRVVFENDATPKAVHSVIAEDGTFTSPPLQPGKRWAIKFTSKGSHAYHDPTAYAQMVGVIVVVSASTVLQSPAPPGSVATVVAKAKGIHGANQQSSGTLADILWWLLVPVAAVVGGLCYIIYRKYRKPRSATPKDI